jgi:hypothetical protein
VNKFVYLHYGFEKPTPEIMAAWGKWFASMKDNIIDMGGPFQWWSRNLESWNKGFATGTWIHHRLYDRERRQP